MSRGGAVGGPATLSSFRVQKAFSINFRENKRLRATLKLIEGEHMRAIRQVKQEITETKLWLEGVQENTGYSQHGLPNTDRHSVISPSSRRMSLPASIASGERSSPRMVHRNRTSQDLLYGEVSPLPAQRVTEEAMPPSHVRFAWTDQGPRNQANEIIQPKPPLTANPESGYAPAAQVQAFSRRSSFLPKAEQINSEEQVLDKKNAEEDLQNEVQQASKPRLHSATSGKSNQSLTAYQRRRQLQSMVVKKLPPLEIKKDINRKECFRVNNKVMDYLTNLAEKMKINLPDVSMFDFDPDKHGTPFARDVNVTQ